MTALLRQVLDRELTLLSEMAHWLGMGPGRPIKQARVDSLTIQGSKKCIARAREDAPADEDGSETESSDGSESDDENKGAPVASAAAGSGSAAVVEAVDNKKEDLDLPLAPWA